VRSRNAREDDNNRVGRAEVFSCRDNACDGGAKIFANQTLQILDFGYVSRRSMKDNRVGVKIPGTDAAPTRC
jgi:hypothetical protein